MSPADPTRTHAPARPESPTGTFDPDLDAGLAAAFGRESTPGGWSQPPLLRDVPSDFEPLVQPSSPEMPRAADSRYQLLGEIARGGMGVIIKGRDPDLGRDLAFKVLKAELAGKPAAEQRFVEEAQVGGQLQHPGVVPVYDLGRFADGRPYFAMKLVKGRTLADMLTERADPGEDRGKFLQAFLQVCQTVAYAHSRGVIHRDIKPANVMVASFGEVLVMDWGLAKVLPRGGVADEEKASRLCERPEVREEPTVIHTSRSGSGSETAAGSVMGTPAFMSPEQAGGEVDKLDERADVFGLGAVLCVILTGQPPYVADSSEAVRLMAVRGQLAEAFARLDACATDAELVELCKRCLSSVRDERPRHAGELAGAVAAHLAEVEGRAQRAEVARAAAEAKTGEERKRRRAQLALAASVGLLLMGGGAFGWWQDKQSTARRIEAENRERDEHARRARNADALEGLLGRCETALRDGDADRAAAAMEEIDRRMAEAGGEGAAERAARCRSDLTMLRELDAIDAFRWTPIDDKLPSRLKLPPRWRAAFAAHGIGVTEATSAEAARQVSASLIRGRLLTALDLWLAADRDPGVRTVLRAADPDPYRDAIRDAATARDAKRTADLAGRPEALAQPPWFATALVWYQTVPAERRRAVLESALRSRPGDLTLLMSLGSTYPFFRRDDAAEQARWFQAAVATHPSTVTTHNSLGSVLLIKGDLDGAAACFEEAIRLRPNYARAHDNLGRALRQKGELDRAVACFREAMRLDPKLASPHTNLGILRAEKKDYDAAIASYREAIRLDPRFLSPHFNIGIALRGKGDVDGAIASFKDVIRLDPNYVTAHINLGALLCDVKKDYDGAIASFKEAIRLDPKNASAHFNLANALQGKGDVDGAIAAFKEAIRIDPTLAPIHHNLGYALMRKGDVGGAIASFKEAIRIDPKLAAAHSNLGLALQQQGDVSGAIAACQEAIRLDPKDASSHTNLGRVLGVKGDMDGAIACLQEAIRLNPKLAVAHTNMGNALFGKGDLVGAIASYQEAIRLDPKDPLFRNNLARALIGKGDFDGAIASYQEVIRLKPKDPLPRKDLARVLLRKGDFDGAIASYQEVIRLKPKDSSARFDLENALNAKGSALCARGDLDGAVASYREAIRLNPKQILSHYSLGNILQQKGDMRGAIASYKETVLLQPFHTGARNTLAWLLAAGPDGVRDGKLAVEHATRACELIGWKNATWIDTLAAAYAEVGEFDKAVEYGKKALSCPGLTPALVAKVKKHLAMYEKKKPYRDPALARRELAPMPREVKR